MELARTNSLTLSSLKCSKCNSNNYLSLVLVFIQAGVALLASLLLLHITVAYFFLPVVSYWTHHSSLPYSSWVRGILSPRQFSLQQNSSCLASLIEVNGLVLSYITTASLSRALKWLEIGFIFSNLQLSNTIELLVARVALE